MKAFILFSSLTAGYKTFMLAVNQVACKYNTYHFLSGLQYLNSNTYCTLLFDNIFCTVMFAASPYVWLFCLQVVIYQVVRLLEL